MSVGLFLVLMFTIFCTYSIIRKIVSLIEMNMKHEMTMQKIDNDLKVEKIEFDDIKEGDLK